MLLNLIYLFLTVLVYILSTRFVLKKKNYGDEMIPRALIAGVFGALWPVTLPAGLFAWAINKVLDKFTKV